MHTEYLFLNECPKGTTVEPGYQMTHIVNILMFYSCRGDIIFRAAHREKYPDTRHRKAQQPSWPMFAYDLTPVCLACAWVLVQNGRADMGSRVDVKIVSPVLSRAESRFIYRHEFEPLLSPVFWQKTNLITNFPVIHELEILLRG